MLQAENLKTWETGFFRASLDGGEPKQLVMAAQELLGAREGEERGRVPAHRQTFNEFPDLLTTDGTFKELRKVSERQPAEGATALGNARRCVSSRTPTACR